jgi:uncharacterized membrane protein YfcA
MNKLDKQALRAGASVALVFAVPFSVAARWVADSNDSSEALAAWLSLAALAGFVVGAGVAAWVQQRGLPLMHGIVCAVGTYVVAQAVFILVRLLMGREVRWFAAVFNLTAVMVAGALGGGLAAMMHKRGLRPRALARAGQADAGQADGSEGQ